MKSKPLTLGFAEADITPSTSVETIGFDREDQMSHGAMHPLSTQVAVWQLNGEQCCIAAIDHIGFSREHADALRDKIGEALRIPHEKVMLCFSHCYAAPNESASPETITSSAIK